MKSRLTPAPAPGLILDLRSDGGGEGAEGMRVAGYFFDERAGVARVVTRSGKPASALFGLASLPEELRAGERGARLHANPLVVLVNEGTDSTSELVANALQGRGRATEIRRRRLTAGRRARSI